MEERFLQEIESYPLQFLTSSTLESSEKFNFLKTRLTEYYELFNFKKKASYHKPKSYN